MFPLVIPTISLVTSIIPEAVVVAGGEIGGSNLINILRTIPGIEPWLPVDGVELLRQDVFDLTQSVNVINENLLHQTSMLSTIQSSIGALGMVSAAGCVLSAVNLYQLFKVQKSIAHLEKTVADGFIDLKAYFDNGLNNLLENQQKQQLAHAYSIYYQGMERIKTSLLINDRTNRHNHLTHCTSAFEQALSIYDNKYDFQNINLPAKIRRLECCWATQSAIAETFTLQEEYTASLHGYKTLQKRILKDIEGIKYDINENNYHFITSDIHWLYENDLKLLDLKIAFLEDKKTKKVFLPRTLDSNLNKTNIAPLKDITLSCSLQYIGYITSEEKRNEMQSFFDGGVWKTIFGEKSIDNCSLVERCKLYADTLDILDDSHLKEKIIEVTKQYKNYFYNTNNDSSFLGVFKDSKQIYLLDDIPKNTLKDVISSYAKEFKSEEVALVLIDNTILFGSAANDGILLTNSGIYSDEYGKIALEDIHIAELNSSYICLNQNKKISITDNNNISLHFIKLLKEILALIYLNYTKRVSLLGCLDKKEEEKEILKKTLSLNPSDINTLKRLVFLGDEAKYTNIYFDKLIANNDLNGLEDLVKFDKSLLIKYCTHLISLNEKDRLKKLIETNSDNGNIVSLYLEFLLKNNNIDGIVSLFKLQPNNPDVLWTYSLFLEKAKKYDAVEKCLVKLQQIAPFYKTEQIVNAHANVLLQLERYQEALLCYQKLSGISPQNIGYYWQQTAILIRLKRHDELRILLENLQQTEETLICRFLLAMKLQQWDEVKELGSEILESDKHPNVLQFINLIHH